MINEDKVIIFICDSDKDYIEITKNTVTGSNSNHLIQTFESPRDLLKALKDAHSALRPAPDILITSVEFEAFEIDGVQLTTIAKALIEGVVVICISRRFGLHESSTSTAIEALKFGCDAWVKKDHTYREELFYKLRHWIYYVKEKSKLTKLYSVVREQSA